MTVTSVRLRRGLVLADLIPGAGATNVALVLAGTVFIAVSGFVLIPLAFTPVPLSLATFAVLLTGATLGPARAVSSAGLYLVLGVLGLPIFGDGFSGWAFASFGYILGYVAASLVVGSLARRQADRNIWATLGLALAGTVTIYAFGVPWLAVFLSVDFWTALLYGAIPFMIGDAIKIAAITALLPTTWRLVGRTGRH